MGDVFAALMSMRGEVTSPKVRSGRLAAAIAHLNPNAGDSQTSMLFP